MFSTQLDNFTPFVHIFDNISLFAAELENPKIDTWGKGLIHNHYIGFDLQLFKFQLCNYLTYLYLELCSNTDL